MLNKLASTLRNLIVSTIVSVLALIIGIVLVPVYAVFGTVIITLASLAVLYFGYALIKYIKEHRPEKKEKTVKTTKNWRDWVITLTLIGVIVIIVLLLCRGCGKDIGKDVDVLNVGTLNVDVSNVETEHVATQDVEIQDVEVSNVTEQEVVNQTIVEQDVETSNVTEQIVVNQQVTTQTIVEEKKEEPIKEEIPAAPSQPEPPVHTCSVVDTKKTDATCVSEGKVEQVCSCGKVISSTTIAAIGHAWNAGNVTVNATENATGTKTFTCTACGETKSEVIPKLNHECKVVDTITEKATCTTSGKVEQVCSCGKVISSTTTPATGHSWNKGEVTREATENRTGIKTYTCKKCDETKTETIAKLEHVCEIYDEIEIDATCTTKGKIKYICSCGEVLDTETTPKLGHDYEVVSEKGPTATKDGYIKYRCDNCNDAYTETIPAIGEEEDEVTGDAVYLTPSQTYLEAGVVVTVTTTGSTANLEISYDPDVVEYKIVSDKKVTIKWLGTKNGLPAPTAVSIYDVTAMNEESVIDLCSK